MVATSALGHGLRQARPRVLHPRRLAGVAGGLLPAGRPRRAGARRRRRGAAARPRPTSGSGTTSRPPACPTRRASSAILDALGDGPQTLPALETATAIRRGPARGPAEDPGRRRGRSSASRAAGRRTGKPWNFDAAQWDALAQVRAAEADLMRAYAAGEGCLMRFLQQALDDPDPQPCGRCWVCTGELPGAGRARRRPRAIEAARAVLPRPGRDHRAAQAVAVGAAGPQGQDHSCRRAARWPSPTTRLERRARPLWRRDQAAPQVTWTAWSTCCGAGRAPGSGRWPWWPCRRGTPPPWSARSRSTRSGGPAAAGGRPGRQWARAGRRGGIGRTGEGAAVADDAAARRTVRRSGAAGRRHLPQRLDDDRRRGTAGRRRCDGRAAAGHPPAALGHEKKSVTACSGVQVGTDFAYYIAAGAKSLHPGPTWSS